MRSISVTAIFFFSLGICVPNACAKKYGKAEIDSVSIRQTEKNGTLPRVHQILTCGGSATYIQFGLDGCESHVGMCQLQHDGSSIRGQLDFIPDKEVNKLGVRIKVGFDGIEPKPVYDNAVADSAVKAGVQYTVVFVGRLIGGKRTVSGCVEVYDVHDSSLQLCIQAEIDLMK